MRGWDKLPHEVLYQIFSFLKRADLANCIVTCKAWYASANDDLLWKRLFLAAFELPKTTVIKSNAFGWKTEHKRLTDEVPSELVQTLTQHTNEVLHVRFSHDGQELVSCSKDHTFIVWTDQIGEGFQPCFHSDMSFYAWEHTWAAQFSPNDSLLMVSGVVSEVKGEIAIFSTGRSSHQRGAHGNYQILSRVANDPYDMLGCWCTDRFFLSGSIKIYSPSIVASVWLCQPVQADGDISLGSTLKVLCKYANPPGGEIYARFLQVHPRSAFNYESLKWPSIDAPMEEYQSDEEMASVDLPAAEGVQNSAFDLAKEAQEIIDQEMCLIFICSSRTFIPHQIGFQRIKASDLTEHTEVRNSAEKVVDLEGHIVGIGLSPDYRELYVNVRCWPSQSVPTMDNPPCISNQIEMRVIDLETFQVKPQPLRGHVGVTPSEEAFYLYLDVSQNLVGSGSEDKKGYIWDRYYQCNVSKLEHNQCVNCVAFRPSAVICATASDDHTIKIWQSKQETRKRRSTCAK